MDNPKIRIESDGITAEVYLDGEKVNRCNLIDFEFHGDVADGIHIAWSGAKHKVDENGNLVIENDEIVTEEFHYNSQEQAN